MTNALVLLLWIVAFVNVAGYSVQAADTAPSRATLLFSALIVLQAEEKDETIRSPARKALRYLIENMPESDLGKVGSYTLATITLKRMRKRTARWPAVPWEIFVEFTLPYASLSEPRDQSLSAGFMDQLEAYVDKSIPAGTSLFDAVSLLNAKAFQYTDPPIKFVSAPPNKVNAYSAFEVVGNKTASCTGEAIFLVHALRLAGIPARVAGVPHWNRGRDKCPDGDRSPVCGNHNWVEAYTEKGWVFLDQNTGNPPNHAWFVPELTKELVPGSKFHSVYAATWNRRDPAYFPLVFDPYNAEVPAIERTKWYQSFSDPSKASGDHDNDIVVTAVA